MLAGAIDLPDFATRRREWQAAKWIPPRWDWIDPLKDLQAEKLAVDAGFKARSDVVEAQGFDVEETDARIAADHAREEALGAHDMRKMAGALDRIKEAMVGIYAARTDQEPDEVARMMTEETWMSAAEAVDLGFADRLEQPVAINARFDLSRYRHPPKAFMKLTTEDDMPPADEQPPAPTPDALPRGGHDAAPPASTGDPAVPEPLAVIAPLPADEQAVVQARAAGVAYAAEVVDLCAFAGRADRVAGFIAATYRSPKCARHCSRRGSAVPRSKVQCWTCFTATRSPSFR